MNTNVRPAVFRWVVEEWADGDWKELGYVEAVNGHVALAVAHTELDVAQSAQLRVTRMKEV